MNLRFSLTTLLFSVLLLGSIHPLFAQNVGIGTTAPATQLHVDGNTTQHTGLMLENDDIQAGLELESQSATGLGEAILNIGVATNRAILEKGTDPAAAWLRMDTRSGVRRFQWFWEEQGSNTESVLMALQHNGNLGIGTNSPVQKLHVAGGNAFVAGTSWSTAGDQAFLILGDGNHGIRANWGEGVTVFTSGAGNGIVLEQSSGNVGIGAADPTSALDVVNANQALTLRAGNGSNNYSKNQIMMGFNGTAQYRHAIKSRHNGSSGSQNAMDFFVWDQTTDDVDDVGTLHTMSLNNGEVGIGIENPVGKLDVQSDGGFFLQDVTSASVGMPASFPFNALDMTRDHRVRFTASESGPLQYIQLRIEDGPGAVPPNTITLELYNGDVPTGGTPIATSNPILVSNDFYINHNFIFPTEPNITAGNTYTFRIVGTTTKGVWLTYTSGANNYYLDGVLESFTSVGHLVAVEQPLDNRLVFNSGGLGINVLSPNEALDINGQIRMRAGATNGYIPVSDANGVMTWTDPSTITTAPSAADGDWTINGTDQYSAVSGNVGIGTSTPSRKLAVIGDGFIQGSQGFNAANETATLYMGDPNHGLTGTFAEGIRMFTDGATNGIVLRQTSGFVGLGVDDPLSRLHLSDNVATFPIDNFNKYQLLLFRGSDAQTSYGLGISAGSMWFNSNDAYRFITDGTNENMTILESGNVGMGETNPDAELHVFDGDGNTTIMMENTNVAAGMELEGQGGGNAEGIFNIGMHTARGIIEKGTDPDAAWMRIDTRPSSRSFGFFWEEAGSNTEIQLLTILPNGRVGIGTANPDATLEVDGSVSATETYRFYNSTGEGPGGSGTGSFTNNYSIRASHAILASEFNAFSDERIKNIQSRVSAGEALEKVMALQPTHYHYIDSISKGTTEKTGFIAQEVKAVVPEAVTDNQKRFIPDVYALANEVSYDETSGQLAVRLPNAHPLLAGDSIKCITPEGEATAIVSAVGDDNTLMLDNWAGGTPADELESLFVFGKWVRDFHTVDYDHLYTLGISAIQALQQQLADVKAEQSVMKAELKAERQHNADQEARLKHIERMMGERAER